ncbi:MAG TPA: NUDIX hydrolase [Anaerolineales bacterium]|jgi:ADP-ribose pyrophosphatase|nr:NUDIX hydrolase [Anaerolineales bacterium]
MKPERLAREIIYQSPWVNLYLDTVQFPNGFFIEKFHLLDFPSAAVTAIVEDDSENILFVRICRYTSGRTEWEIPAGGMEAGETEIDAAKREVLEETGYRSENHELMYSYRPMNGSTNQIFHVIRCRAIDFVQEFDKNEVSETRWFAKEEVTRMIKDKVITDGFTLTALLLWLQDG